MASFAVILPAAGNSSRFNDPFYKKPFAPLESRPVWLHAAERFVHRADVKQTILVISPADRELFDEKFGGNAAILGVEVVEGGAERYDSVERALQQVRPEIDFIAVHDAARPCLAEAWIDAVFAAAERTGAALMATPIHGTIKRANGQKHVQETVSRQNLWEAQTPQVFRRDLLLKAYAQRGTEPATDDCQLVEWLGHPIEIVPGSPMNLKITTKEDLRLAAAILKALPQPKLFGPAHPFTDDHLWR